MPSSLALRAQAELELRRRPQIRYRSRWYDSNPDDLDTTLARAKQRPPSGSWLLWLVLAGRGWGKTITGAEFTNTFARRLERGQQLIIAGRTPSDVRDYSLLGPGGLLTRFPDIQHHPSRRLLVWPNGVEGLIRSGANPEEFRGYSGPGGWLDEFAAWDYPTEAWNNLMFGVREGTPRICMTTTPRPLPILRELIGLSSTVTTKGHSRENSAHLSESFIRNVLDRVEGTRLGRQESQGELLDDVEGALWNLARIDSLRVHPERVPQLKRIAVGVDPQGTKSDEILAVKGSALAPGGEIIVFAHETGVVAAGLGTDDHIYVLRDASLNGTPNEWGSRAVHTYDELRADCIVGEKNFGGDMVEHTVRTVARNAAFKAVTASRGKERRAEPVAALYEQGRAHHVGAFPALEDEMCTYTPSVGTSPNRMDALVWAVTELLEEPEVVPTECVW